MDVIKKYVEDILWIQKEFKGMDDGIDPRPLLGIREWDDAVCLEFQGRLVVSSDGPYTKRLVMKSVLVHASTDVVVKGGRPLFAMDSVIGPKEDVREMIYSLKRQSQALSIPILGGNTLYEDVEPRCCLTVIGKLVVDEPISDAGTREGDYICLLGEPVWGEQDERLVKARILFDTWFTATGSVKINSAKDVTKGGIASAVHEMEKKSGKKYNLKDKMPYPLTRNLDNFILTLPREEYKKLEEICQKTNCPIERIGEVF